MHVTLLVLIVLDLDLVCTNLRLEEMEDKRQLLFIFAPKLRILLTRHPKLFISIFGTRKLFHFKKLTTSKKGDDVEFADQSPSPKSSNMLQIVGFNEI